MSMLDWNAYRKQLASTIGEIAKAAPDLVKGYRTLVASRATTGALDAKTRELVALAVAVTVRCDGCIATHVDFARKHGATADEITDMIGPGGKEIPPTGKSFEVDFCTVARWDDNGQIVEENLFYDVVGMMKQIGLG